MARINPDGLPIVGVVVTLEPFHLVNTIIHDLIGSADIPVLVASSHELEGFIAAVYDRTDVGGRFVAAFNRPNLEPPTPHAANPDGSAKESAPHPLHLRVVERLDRCQRWIRRAGDVDFPAGVVKVGLGDGLACLDHRQPDGTSQGEAV